MNGCYMNGQHINLNDFTFSASKSLTLSLLAIQLSVVEDLNMLHTSRRKHFLNIFLENVGRNVSNGGVIKNNK